MPSSFKTVDVEVKAAVHAQRVRDAEIRIESRLPNGPLRAQRKEQEVCFPATEYSAT